MQEAESKNQILVKVIDNTWESVKWKVGLAEDLSKSGIREKVRDQYIEIFQEGKRRYDAINKKGQINIFSYMRAKKSYGELAQELGYIEDFKPLLVLINDGNLLDESSFSIHCKHFTKEAKSLGIYFIVCGGGIEPSEISDLCCDIDMTREWSVLVTEEGYRKVYIEIPKF